MIFGQFRAILLLGPSKSLLVGQKVDYFLYYGCDGGEGGGGGEGKLRCNCLMFNVTFLCELGISFLY